MDVDAVRARLAGSATTNIGFPAACDAEYPELADLLTGRLLNNLGDPFVTGSWPGHTKDVEQEVIEWFCDFFNAPPDDRWGYVTSGGTEGNLFALWTACKLYPDAVVYHSDAAHPSIDKAIDILDLASVRIATCGWENLDYDDLRYQLDTRRDRPAIIVATAGTTMAESVDDVACINDMVNELVIRRRWLHVDAALSGVPLATLTRDHRPGLDFADGADSIALSGHKFIGAPFPCGVILTRRTPQLAARRTLTYAATPDATLLGSRNGGAALVLAAAIARHGADGFRLRAEACRELAGYARRRLKEALINAHRHELGFTVVFDAPSRELVEKWGLATQGSTSHIITMPGVTAEQIDLFIKDLAGER